MKDKKGSHVGMVLSFVLFIVFLIFFYTFFGGKFRISNDNKNALQNLEKNFIDELKSDLIAVVVFNESTGKNCILVNITNFQGLNYIAKDENGNLLGASEEGNFLKVEALGSNENFFKVYFSKEKFESPSTNKDNCEEAFIEATTKHQRIFETKVLELKQEYDSDYSSLKQKLKVPFEDDFWFSFKLANGTLIEGENRTEIGSVYVANIPVHYIDKKANIALGEIQLKLW